MTQTAVRHEGKAAHSAEYNLELSSATIFAHQAACFRTFVQTKRSLTANCTANHFRLTKMATMVKFCVKSTSKSVEGMCPLL